MTRKDIQQTSLEILKDVHRFCVEHCIRYVLFAGTQIGAVRHNGFIPWDDDVDIAMPRPDYERFCRLYHSEAGYQCFCRENSNCYISYARVCDMKRTIVDCSAFPWVDKTTGIWIDLFPLDGAEDDYNEASKRLEEIIVPLSDKCWKVRVAFAKYSSKKNILKKIKLFLYKLYMHGYEHNPCFDKHIEQCKLIPFGSTSHYSNWSFNGYGMREYHNMSTINTRILHSFEDTEFYIMGGYDEALKDKYGDYMKLPPEDKRGTGHIVNKRYWRS